jgi:hypothetical protein
MDWQRPLPSLPATWTGAYDDAALWVARVRNDTIAKHSQDLFLWLYAMDLIASAFGPKRVYTCGKTEIGTGSRSCGLRVQLLALAGRSSKPALDLALTGYYTEAWSLLRSMLDGWARCAYVRLSNKEYHRWYATEPEEQPAGRSADRDLNWGEFGRVINASDDEDLKRLFADARLHWGILNVGVHPSGEGITLVWNDDHEIVTFRPEYREDFCRNTFAHAGFVHMVLLSEIRELGSHSAGWLEHVDDFTAGIASLLKSARPMLDEWERLSKR